eukprot:2115873-Heterocapsa_arctica.AAC.1
MGCPRAALHRAPRASLQSPSYALPRAATLPWRSIPGTSSPLRPWVAYGPRANKHGRLRASPF